MWALWPLAWPCRSGCLEVVSSVTLWMVSRNGERSKLLRTFSVFYEHAVPLGVFSVTVVIIWIVAIIISINVNKVCIFSTPMLVRILETWKLSHEGYSYSWFKKNLINHKLTTDNHAINHIKLTREKVWTALFQPKGLLIQFACAAVGSGYEAVSHGL